MMDEATRKAVDKIEKLMRLAGKNPNQEEAASALAKAQALLLAYNLDMSTVEAASGQSSRREEANVSGGGYAFQRRLWYHIAQLNMCMYWTMQVRVRPGSYAEKRHRTYTAEHRLVGRTINVQQTKNMASYLHQTVERLRRDAMASDTKSREAFAFREGVVDAVIEKLIDRRQAAVDEERRAAAEVARKAAEAGVSTAKTLTIATLKQKEDDANYDFVHGEGAAAKKRADKARWQQEAAEAEAAAEKEWAEWVAKNPEEAKKLAEDEAKKERARERRQARRGSSGHGRYRFRETAEEQRRGSNVYHMGYKAGEKVSIDPQAEDRTQRRIER